MKKEALDYFKQGGYCSESVILAAIDEGLCDKSLLASAIPFAGGISSGCLCGAVAASLMVIGANFERAESRVKAKEFMDLFKQNHKATCCRVLSAGFEKGTEEHRNNCAGLVMECATILEGLVKVKVQNA